MAFKMKGSSFYGKGNQSPNKMTGDPKKQTSTSATVNLLGRLEDFEANKKEKDYRDAPDTVYRAGDLYGYDQGEDAPQATKNKIAERAKAGKIKQDRNRAESDEHYIANLAKLDAVAAKGAEKRAAATKEREDAQAENQRRAALSPKERRAEDKAIKNAAKKA